MARRGIIVAVEAFGSLSPEFDLMCCVGTGDCTGPNELHLHTPNGPELIHDGDLIGKDEFSNFWLMEGSSARQ